MKHPLLPAWSDVRCPLIGMLHVPPLPGTPNYDGDREGLLRTVLRDAEALAEGGAHGMLLENFGDAPFARDSVPPEIIANLAVLAGRVRQRFPLPLGINVLRNDSLAALAVAQASGADWIRVNVLCGARLTDQGMVQGSAYRLMRRRKELGAESVRVLADVDVKHSVALAPRPLVDEVRDSIDRGGADALIVSGSATGSAVVRDTLRIVAEASSVPVLIGSGASCQNLPDLLPFADGLIVGTALKRNGNRRGPIDVERVREMVACLGS